MLNATLPRYKNAGKRGKRHVAVTSQDSGIRRCPTLYEIGAETDLSGLTARKSDHSAIFRGRGSYALHCVVRSLAGGRLYCNRKGALELVRTY